MNTTTTSTGKRRRATTIAQQERILDMATGLPMTKNVLREVMADATSANLDLIERWFGLELEQRARSRKARLMRQAGFPTAKTLDDYDWSRLKMPADWDRTRLESLEFVNRAEDLVLYGNVGCGKTHLACAIGRLACLNDIPVRFLRRHKPAHATTPCQRGPQTRPRTRLHRQGQTPDHRRIRLHAHRRGRKPPALPDHLRQLRNKEHRLHHQHRIRRLGTHPRRRQHGRRHRPHRPTQ